MSKHKTQTLLLNLFGGPGTGKSTVMAGVFAELKLRGVNCEMVPEYAKRKVWEKSLAVLDDQVYVFGKQLHSIVPLLGQVDVIVTDSPLLLSLIYGEDESPEFHSLVLSTHNKLNNMTIFLRRLKAYNPAGRLQNEKEARKIDTKIEVMLRKNCVAYRYVDAGREAIKEIADMVCLAIGRKLIGYDDPVDNRG